MRKYLLLVLLIGFWGCEEEQDTTPTEVTLWGVDYSVEDTDTIDFCYGEGPIPSEIGYLTNLTTLQLCGNQLTGSIPEEIGNLTNLTELWIANHPQLSGSIPEEIGNLTNLEYLWLHNNELIGSIPEEIGNLTKLVGLNLGGNQLSGSIPEEIGNLTNLTYLYLFENQLSGEVPESICNLNFDWWYDEPVFMLTHNQLCPPYHCIGYQLVGDQDTTNCE